MIVRLFEGFKRSEVVWLLKQVGPTGVSVNFCLDKNWAVLSDEQMSSQDGHFPY